MHYFHCWLYCWSTRRLSVFTVKWHILWGSVSAMFIMTLEGFSMSKTSSWTVKFLKDYLLIEHASEWEKYSYDNCTYRNSMHIKGKQQHFDICPLLTLLVSSCTVPSFGMFEALSGSFLMLSINSSKALAPWGKNKHVGWFHKPIPGLLWFCLLVQSQRIRYSFKTLWCTVNAIKNSSDWVLWIVVKLPT